jgi:hypothetical protein
MALTSTDPINDSASRGRELLINPSLRLSRVLGKSWRVNLKGDLKLVSHFRRNQNGKKG